jgi:uncharacterized protein with GYD domain
MPKYVILMNLTAEGAKDIKDAPARIKNAQEALEAAGGKLLSLFLTMGPYDYVAIVEGPSDEMAVAWLLGLAQAGLVKTMTMKAFTMEEYGGILAKLP